MSVMPEANRGPLQVLLVEDSPDDADLVLRQLRRGGFDLDWARVETAHELRAALAERTWEVALVDYSLPSFSGPDALRILQEHDPDLPALVVSGTVGEDVAVETLKAGAVDYVLKTNLTRLPAAVERELRDAEVRRQRRRADDDLLRSGERFSTLVNAANQIVWSVPGSGMPDGPVPGWSAFTGQTSDEVVGGGWHDALHPDDRERVDQAWAQSVAAQAVHECEYRLRRHDGEYRWIASRAVPIRDGAGDVVEWIGAGNDVTERRRMEEAVQVSEARLRALLAAMKDVILVVAADGRILEVAPTSPDLLYRPAEDVLGKNIAEVLPDEQARAFQEAIHTALRDARPVEIEHSLTIGGRELWFVGQVSPMDSDVVVLVARDITARRETEEEIKRSEERYRVLVEATSSWVWDHGPDGAFSEPHPAWLAFTGQTVEQAAGWGWLDAVHEDDREMTKQAWARALEVKALSLLHYRLRGHDGAYRWFEVKAMPLFDGEGNVRLWSGLTLDVQDQVTVEDAQRDVERRYRDLFDYSPAALWVEDYSAAKPLLDELAAAGVTDLDGYLAGHNDVVAECFRVVRVVDMNKTMVEMVGGASKEEAIAHWDSTVSANGLGLFRGLLAAIGRGKTSGACYERTVTIGGDPLCISERWTVGPGSEDSYRHVYFTNVDPAAAPRGTIAEHQIGNECCVDPGPAEHL